MNEPFKFLISCGAKKTNRSLPSGGGRPEAEVGDSAESLMFSRYRTGSAYTFTQRWEQEELCFLVYFILRVLQLNKNISLELRHGRQKTKVLTIMFSEVHQQTPMEFHKHI